MRPHLAVNGVSEGIHNAAKESITSGDVHNGASALHNITLTDELVVTEDDDTDVVRLQVESHALRMRGNG